MKPVCKEQDTESREQKILQNQGLVWHVVRRFENRGVSREDLFQIGCIGLIKAVDRFDASYEVQFSTYAVPLIIGEIKRFFRDDGMIKVSRELKAGSIKIKQAQAAFFAKHGQEATLEELEEMTGFGRQTLLLAMEAGREVESISRCEEDMQAGVHQTDKREQMVLERMGAIRPEEQIINKVFLQQLLDTLEEKERQVLELRYLKEWKQTKVAQALGMSQVQVSRMERRLLARLRQSCQ